MSRPIRIEYEHATYHVTSRGDRKDIYKDEIDRKIFLKLLAKVIEDYNWVCHGYCLMDNHYHLLIETPDANLSKGMRQLNGVYTQSSNRRHQLSGRIFQGRYKAILVNADAYLLELTRYIVLNPVAAGMVEHPGNWKWSSYGSMVGENIPPVWLATDGLLAQFSERRSVAIQRYIRFVDAGIGGKPIWSNLRRQIYLGDDAFIQSALLKCERLLTGVNIPRYQRRPPVQSLAAISHKNMNRNEAIIAAYRTGEYSYQQIANHFRIHFSTVGRIVRGSS